MEQVFGMEGKAQHVFKYLKLVSKYKGQTTVKDLKNAKKAGK
jgi:hypothetical protein